MLAVEAAYQVLKEHGRALDVQDLLDETLSRLGLDRVPEQASRIYTEINLDVRFVYKGASQWALKEWNPRGGTGKAAGVAMRDRYENDDEDSNDGEEDDSWQ